MLTGMVGMLIQQLLLEVLEFTIRPEISKKYPRSPEQQQALPGVVLLPIHTGNCHGPLIQTVMVLPKVVHRVHRCSTTQAVRLVR